MNDPLVYLAGGALLLLLLGTMIRLLWNRRSVAPTAVADPEARVENFLCRVAGESPKDERRVRAAIELVRNDIFEHCSIRISRIGTVREMEISRGPRRRIVVSVTDRRQSAIVTDGEQEYPLNTSWVVEGLFDLLLEHWRSSERFLVLARELDLLIVRDDFRTIQVPGSTRCAGYRFVLSTEEEVTLRSSELADTPQGRAVELHLRDRSGEIAERWDVEAEPNFRRWLEAIERSRVRGSRRAVS